MSTRPEGDVSFTRLLVGSSILTLRVYLLCAIGGFPAVKCNGSLVASACCGVACSEWGPREKETLPRLWDGNLLQSGSWSLNQSWFGVFCEVQTCWGTLKSGVLHQPGSQHVTATEPCLWAEGTGPSIFSAGLLFSEGLHSCWGLSKRQGFAHAAGANPGLALQEAWTLTAEHLHCHWHCCHSALSAGEASAVWTVPPWEAVC